MLLLLLFRGATTKGVAARPLLFCKGRDARTARRAAPSNIKCFYPFRMEPEATPGANDGVATKGPAARPLQAFFARGVTPSPHVQSASSQSRLKQSTFKAPHVQAVTNKLIFIRPQISGTRTHEQAARPLRLFARGVTPASFPASAVLFCHIFHFEIQYCISGSRQHHHLSPSTFILIFQSFS